MNVLIKRRAAALSMLGLACGAAAGQPVLFSHESAPSGLDADVHQVSINTLSKMLSGGVVGDFNNDGWIDIFLLGGGGFADRLYINNGDGTFTDQAAAWGIDATHCGSGAIAGDYNADGHLDIYVTSHGPTNQPAPGHHKLYRNNGDGTFTDVGAAAGVNQTDPTRADGFGAAFGDYDLDGDLDLAVAGWQTSADGNRLFRNEGDGTFTDVTDTAILFDMFPVRGFAPRFVDMDGDRYPELLWVADFSTSKYLINNTDGTFTEATASSNTGHDHNGMGTTVGDFNADGLLDWYVTSIYVTGGPAGYGEGNKLYINQGNHVYQEVSVAAGVEDGGWGWGAAAEDFDHDGLVDIVATNGWFDSGQDYDVDPTRLFMNNGDGTFAEQATFCSLIHTDEGRGLSTLDYDNDGDMDVLIFNYSEKLDLFRNDVSGPGTNWLKVSLDNSAYPGIAPDGIGAVVEITVAGESQIRPIEAGSNYLAGSEMVAHFGLGSASSVDELVVKWPDGRISTRTGVAANQSITLTPACDGDVDDSNEVNVNDIGYVIFRLGNTGTPGSVDGDADGNGTVNVNDIGYVIFRLGGC